MPQQRKRVPNETRSKQHAHPSSMPSSRAATTTHVGRAMRRYRTCLTVLVVLSTVVFLSNISTGTDDGTTAGLESDQRPVQKLTQWPPVPLPPQRTCNRGKAGSCICARSDPLEPSTRGDQWRRAFEMNLALLADDPRTTSSALDVVLLGDSITEGWNGRMLGRPRKEPFAEDVQKVFDSLFRREKGGRVDGIALGIGGDRINHLMWRMQNGEIPPSLKSRVYWLLIGTNDLSGPRCSPEVVLQGIIACVELLRTQKPNSIIVLNSILPRTSRHDRQLLGNGPPRVVANDADDEAAAADRSFDYWPIVQSVNRGMERYAAGHNGVGFYNATGVFLEAAPDGGSVVGQGRMPDRLHPSVEGHRVWGNGIVDYLINEIGV